MMSPVITALLFSLVTPFVTVLSAPALDSTSIKQNGASAQHLNTQFASLKKTDPCDGATMACVEGSFAQCVNSKWQTTECTGGTQCFALPLVNKVGTSITCDTKADAESRISETGVSGGITGSGSGSTGSFLATVDYNDDSNCTDATGSNSTSSVGTMNSGADPANPDVTSNNSSSDSSGDASSDCGSDATVTVTMTPSNPFASLTVSATRSATLAPGFTLPPTSASDVSGTNATPTVTSSFSSATDAASSLSFNSTDTSVNSAMPTDFVNTTQTLSPASASAFLSSLSVANPGISISTIGESSAAASTTPSSVTGANAAAATGGSSSSSAISLSLFSTSLASASVTQTSLAAVASPSATAGGYGGYGYRIRRMGRSF